MSPSSTAPRHVGISKTAQSLVKPNDGIHKNQLSYISSTKSSTPLSSVTPVSSFSKPEAKKQSRISRWITDWITDWWGLELICWVISALSILAVVILLESRKNRPLPEWPLAVTINSLISILATIGQMAMMTPVVECISQLKWIWFYRKEKLADFQAFDDASRGPTGSLMLIGKLRGLHLVTIGAVIVVCSIFFGAFAQQVVTYPLHSHPAGTAFTPFVYNITGNTATMFESALSPAVPIGLATNGSIPLGITPTCSTGNCSWPEYTSLGICVEVTDISSSISRNACNQSALNEFFQQAGLENPGYPCFNYTLPFEASNDLIFDDLSEKFSFGNVTLTNVVPLLTLPTQMQFMTVTSSPSNATLTDSYIMYQPDIVQSLNSSLASPLAFHFGYNLCLQTYSTTVTNGSASTTILSSQPFNPNVTEFHSGPHSYSVEGDSESTISADGIDFGISRVAFGDISNVFMSNFQDNCFLSLNETQTIDLGSSVLFCYTSGFFATFFAQGAFVSDPLSVAKRLTQNIATSLINVFLSGAGGDALTTQHQGTAFSPTPFVGTDYRWLIFPMALVFLTLVFLIATISKSHRLGSRVWKSSTAATMQGLHEELHGKFGGLTSINEMNEKANSVKVRFDAERGKNGQEKGNEFKLMEVEYDGSKKG